MVVLLVLTSTYITVAFCIFNYGPRFYCNEYYANTKQNKSKQKKREKDLPSYEKLQAEYKTVSNDIG